MLSLLSKLYLIRNIIRKSELLQTVSIHKYCVLLLKTVKVKVHAILRRLSTLLRFTGLTYTTQGYETYLVPIISCIREYCTPPSPPMNESETVILTSQLFQEMCYTLNILEKS